MAKKREVIMQDEVLNPVESERMSRALSVMKKSNKRYKPVPKFRGGCKNC